MQRKKPGNRATPTSREASRSGWSWTATASGTATISTAGSQFDTTLGVYVGTAVNALTAVASNDDETTGGEF